ncbi:hypothetical protein FA13DRAFT_221802 [Coprinellus micaceus]|uniref:Uncharacterized protein n=1 Tax=Coprinellus micaceus TaxID=71717 RepID=A0A4Y7TEU8_COPMI|nr:hypothetical protein FA13DRAFT_221802 [Coprinellus micaceus]
MLGRQSTRRGVDRKGDEKFMRSGDALVLVPPKGVPTGADIQTKRSDAFRSGVHSAVVLSGPSPQHGLSLRFRQRPKLTWAALRSYASLARGCREKNTGETEEENQKGWVAGGGEAKVEWGSANNPPSKVSFHSESEFNL